MDDPNRAPPLAGMSHELRTPLNGVIGLADLLLLEGADPLTERQRQYVEGIAQSGRELLALVDDLLDLAKLDAGTLELELATVSARDAVNDAVTFVQALSDSLGVTLTAHVGEDVPPLRADPQRLRQILHGLITSAVKAAPREGRVDVDVSGADGAIAISIHGAGDRPAEAGLAFALTKKLIEMHRGSIDVTSVLGAGSTFTLRFAAAEPVAHGKDPRRRR